MSNPMKEGDLEALPLTDEARLDFLETAHAALNRKYGTDYGWKLIINHNVIRAMVKNCHPWDGKDGIDLHDSEGGNAKCKTCREAIDEARKHFQRHNKDITD